MQVYVPPSAPVAVGRTIGVGVCSLDVVSDPEELNCGGDEFGSSYESSSPAVDFGRFLTSIVVVTGFALPIVLSHAGVITGQACIMSIAGGG